MSKEKPDKWIYAEKDFTGSLEAISEVERLLSCNSCGDLMQKVVTLWSCEHLFCHNCVIGMDQCPKCLLPAWAEDQRENRTITNIAKLCSSLKDLLESYMKETKVIAESRNAVQDTDPKSLSSSAVPSPSTTTQSVTGNSKNDDTTFQTPQKKVGKRRSTRSVALQDFSNEGQVTPSPNKCSKMAKRVYVSPRYSVQTNSPHRPPILKTPKSLKKNKRGETALHVAAIKGQLQEVLTILDQGVFDINMKDNAGWTPLHEACNHGHYKIVEVLINGGALINVPGYENQTPLMDAVSNGHADIVKLLLDKGADVWSRDGNGNTAISIAKDNDMKSILEKFSSSQDTEQSFSTPNEESLPDFAPDDITLTCSSSVDNSSVKKCCAILNAKLDAGSAVNASHLVVSSYLDNRCPRSLKYLQSLAKGSWVVQYDWIEACLISGHWVNENSFEILGSNNDLVTGGPKRSRLNRASQCPGIFHGCHFYFSGSFKSPGLTKEALGELVQLADGILLTREPKPDSDSVQSCTKVPYHAKAGTSQYFRTYYIVYDSEQGRTPRMVRRGKVCTVPVSWLIACVSQFLLDDIPA